MDRWVRAYSKIMSSDNKFLNFPKNMTTLLKKKQVK